MKFREITKSVDVMQLAIVLMILLFFGTMFWTFRAGSQANVEATEKNREYGKRIEVYARASNCFQAVPYTQRTDAYISQCYDLAESQVGVKVQRYGNIEN